MRILVLIGILSIAGWSFGQIRVSSPVKDLGDIFEKSGKVTVAFELTNPYRKDTIFITDISTSCGCTAVLSADTLILPASTISIDVSYDPTGRLGLFVKSVELTTRTGLIEENKLFLKIAGNVVAENFTVQKRKQELVNYSVAPLYFYPISSYDTSYLDFNYISSFIDDLTYEIDFYQFTTVGIEVDLPGYTDLEDMEHLIFYVKRKVKREFGRRGFDETTVFFDEPIFRKATDLPQWAGGGIRLFSVNFDADDQETQIELTTDLAVAKSKILLDYERFAMPEMTDILSEINMEMIEGKLFLNGELDLSGTLSMPWKKSDKFKKKTAKELKKAIQKQIKNTTGAGKKEVRIHFDSLGIHEEDKYRFVLWDEADLEEVEKFEYEEKPDQIVAPFLPTFKGSPGVHGQIDTTSEAFKHFWENCVLNSKAGYDIEFLIVIAQSELNNTISARHCVADWTDCIENEFREICLNSFDSTKVNIKTKKIKNGPQFDLGEISTNREQPEVQDYFTIIPIVHNNPELSVKPASPYMVNFDFFFKGINTGAWGFQRFANYLDEAVKKDGFVEIRIESSISKIEVEEGVSNNIVAYNRLVESEKRIRAAMAKKLVDPNRIIFVDESVIEQGPEYDGTIPILKYRNFHYIRLIPEESLK